MKKKILRWLFGLQTFSPDEEDWGVVADDVPVALLCVELHCKTTRVPGVEDVLVVPAKKYGFCTVFCDSLQIRSLCQQ